MYAAEILTKIQQLVYDLVARLSSQKAVSEALVLSDGHISRLLNGDRTMTLDQLLKLLDVLPVSLRLVVDTVMADRPVEPVHLLRAFRKGDGLCSRCFLEAVADFVPAAGERREKEPAPGTSAHRTMLLKLEEERFQDADGAKARLEGLVLDWLDFEPKPPELRGDIATALSIWASIQRVRDHHDDASTAYEQAFAFVAEVRDPWVLGLLHQKVAALMMDLKLARLGIELLTKAHLYFVQAKDQAFQARVCIDLGTLHSSLGEHEEALSSRATAKPKRPSTGCGSSSSEERSAALNQIRGRPHQT